ncbi:Beta-glucosidase protein, partial [Thalictrum thalictroides]
MQVFLKQHLTKVVIDSNFLIEETDCAAVDPPSDDTQVNQNEVEEDDASPTVKRKKSSKEDGSLEGGINQSGIDHYKDVLNELELNGIEPYVTLLHNDSPQALQDKYGGFLSKDIVNDFRDYCDICFENFGDKVKHWVTINEPIITAQYGYSDGSAPPARCSPWKGCKEGNSGKEPYIVMHHMILAHASAAQLYKQKYKAKQRGEIGIAILGNWFLPYSDLPEDLAASDRFTDFYIG